MSSRLYSLDECTVPRTVSATCTVCGCVCDDLVVQIDSSGVSVTNIRCELAEEWFGQLEKSHPPIAQVGESSVELSKALDAAADLLRESRSPLIYGLSASSTPGQRAAVALADRIGATIDTTASRCHAPSIMAVQQVGESTCSLGEATLRADLVIYWGVDPLKTHPRHLERVVEPTGKLLEGRERKIVVVDTEANSSESRADMSIRLTGENQFEALWVLRGLVKGIELEPSVADRVPFNQLAELAKEMKSSRCGVVFFGLGLTQGELGPRTVEALLVLTQELNDYTRFHARRMRMYGDVAGADSVLCWQTGYPFSVNLACGYPRYNPGEYSASEMLERGEVDCAVIVGGECIEVLTEEAQRQLTCIPTILLESPGWPASFTPSVRFCTGIYGVHAVGTAYRMDEVPLPLEPFLTSEYPTDEFVLQEIERRLV
ncbi:MAG: formylmethanofuran dehydrogenase subunit B [Planctomycetaceae bacterium]|nr:formylmethanofuran dehydrogenase subunit B [Planctomycetaceae bacterium]